MEMLLIVLLVALYYLVGFILAFFTGRSTIERLVYVFAWVFGGPVAFVATIVGWVIMDTLVSYYALKRLVTRF